MSDVTPTQRIYATAFLYALAVFTLAAVIVGITATVILLGDVRDLSADNKRLNQQSKAFNKLLVECTTPAEERHPPVKVEVGADDCYQRSQRQTAAAVGQIGNISVIAATCGSKHPGDVPATRVCVEDAIEKYPPPEREVVPK